MRLKHISVAALALLLACSTNAQTQFNNIRVGDVGHGPVWGAFAHASQFNPSGYGLLQSNDGNFTFLNKANTGGGYIGFRIANQDKAVLTNAGNFGIGTTAPVYKLDVAGEVIASGWMRTRGVTGWYNESYGGGWYMADHVWVRSYGSKNIYCDQMIRADQGFQVSGKQIIEASGNIRAISSSGAGRIYFQSPHARWNWETGNGNEQSAILTRWDGAGANGRQVMIAQFDGNIRIPNLAGSGNRMVVADAGGLLFTQPIPSGGSGSFNGNLNTTLNISIPYDEMIHLTRQNASGINKDYWFKIGGDRAFVLTDGSTPVMRYLPGNYANGSCYNQWQFRGELKVKSDLSSSCPDYVFEKDYVLEPLEKRAAYLEKNKHLPGVPAAKEVAENGLGVTEMSFGQLKNLEELYLYVIDIKKEVEQLKKENAALKQQLFTEKK
jgi:Bacterial shufflon protein, N-terminal constant region